MHYGFQRGQVSRVCQFVKADDPVFRVVFFQIVNIVGADESRSACHQNSHSISSLAMVIRYWP